MSQKTLTRDQVAKDVRVRFIDGYEPYSLSNKHLSESPIIYISEKQISNDSYGEYVHLRDEPHFNTGYAYLQHLVLEFPITKEVPLDEITEVLNEAKLQIEYLHNKFQETGTGNAVIAQIDNVLSKI